MSKRTGRGTNESAFTRWFCEQLEHVNAVTIAIVANTMGRSGLPDRYVCHRRFRGWLEFKKNDARLSVAQRLTLDELAERGDTVMVVRIVRDDWVVAETTSRHELATADLCAMRVMDDRERALACLDLLVRARDGNIELCKTSKLP